MDAQNHQRNSIFPILVNVPRMLIAYALVLLTIGVAFSRLSLAIRLHRHHNNNRLDLGWSFELVLVWVCLVHESQLFPVQVAVQLHCILAALVVFDFVLHREHHRQIYYNHNYHH